VEEIAYREHTRIVIVGISDKPARVWIGMAVDAISEMLNIGIDDIEEMPLRAKGESEWCSFRIVV
jgi:chemotaxis signal transduction protein